MLSFITLFCTFKKFDTIKMQILIRLKELFYVLLDKVFSNTRLNEKVCIFSHTISNGRRNFVSHKSIVCDKKDPTWFNSKTKSLIQEKDSAYQLYQNDKTNPCF